MATQYTRYYSQQGSGLSNIGKLHYTPIYLQRGSGFGGIFSSLLRYLTPLAHSGLTALKHQAIRSGKAILEDIDGPKTFKDILRERGKEAVKDLTLKGIDKLKRTASQTGTGYIKRRKLMKRSILSKATRPRRPRKVRRKRKNQLGGRRRLKTKQIGGRRRRRTKTKRSQRTRTLDIFN